MAIDLEKNRENRIKSLVKKCKEETDKKGIYTINKDDYSMLKPADLIRVIALIEKDKKYICKQSNETIIFQTKHNPNYKKWYQIDWFTAITTFAFTVAASYITNKLQDTEQTQQIQKISDSLLDQKESLNKLKDSVYNHLSDSTLH